MITALMPDIKEVSGESLEAMINAHGKAILRYCHLLLRDYHEAQDVVQTTFLKAFTKRTSRRNQGNRGNRNKISDELAPWLYKTAYNHCIDILRKRKKQVFSTSEAQEDNVGKKEPEAAYYMEDGMSEDIKAALGVLSPEDRALVISRIMDDLDFAQLSQIYNASAATLRKRYERAKKKLAEALRETEGKYE